MNTLMGKIKVAHMTTYNLYAWLASIQLIIHIEHQLRNSFVVYTV